MNKSGTSIDWLCKESRISVTFGHFVWGAILYRKADPSVSICKNSFQRVWNSQSITTLATSREVFGTWRCLLDLIVSPTKWRSQLSVRISKMWWRNKCKVTHQKAQKCFMFTFKRPAVTLDADHCARIYNIRQRVGQGETDFISCQKMSIHTMSPFHYATSAESTHYGVFNFVQDHLALSVHLSHSSRWAQCLPRTRNPRRHDFNPG